MVKYDLRRGPPQAGGDLRSDCSEVEEQSDNRGKIYANTMSQAAGLQTFGECAEP